MARMAPTTWYAAKREAFATLMSSPLMLCAKHHVAVCVRAGHVSIVSTHASPPR